MKIALGPEEIKLMGIFERETGVSPKDCVRVGEEVVFVVSTGDAGKCTLDCIRRLSKRLGGRIHLVEHSEDLFQFARNLFRPAEVLSIRLSEDGKSMVLTVREESKGLVFGEGKRKMERARKLMDRYFGVRKIIISTVR